MLLTSLLNSLYESILSLGRKKYWFLVLGLILLAVIFINGVAIIPQEPYQRLSENPFITRTDIHFNNYWQENPLLPIIAFYLNLTLPLRFNVFCFAIMVGAFALFAVLTYQHWGASPSLIFSTLLITSPITTVMLTWMGTPDGLTLALTIPFLFTHSGLLMFSLAIFGIANHPAFAIAVIEILILRWLTRDEIKIRHILLTVTGIAIGYGLTRLFISSNAIEVVSRTDFMQLKDLDYWVKMNLANLPMSLSSLFNIHWLVLFVCLVMFFNRDKKFYLITLAFILINFGLTFFTFDTTRVFFLISWGVLFECMFNSYKIATSMGEAESKQFLQALIMIGIVSILSPRYFSWAGEIHTTPFYEFWRRVFR